MITYKQARLLKICGYPQPPRQSGQHWYVIRYPGGTLEDGVLCIVLASERLAPLHLRRCELPTDAPCYYAPSVEEMLQYLRTELKRDYSLMTSGEANDDDFYLTKETNSWFCNTEITNDPNAADLLARAIVREASLKAR